MGVMHLLGLSEGVAHKSRMFPVTKEECGGPWHYHKVSSRTSVVVPMVCRLSGTSNKTNVLEDGAARA